MDEPTRAAELKKLKALRTPVRTNTTTTISALDKLLKAAEIKVDDVEDQLELLALKESSLENLDMRILDVMDPNDPELEKDCLSVEKYKQDIAQIRTKAKRKLREAGVSSGGSSGQSTASEAASLSQLAASIHQASQEAKLPPLILAKYNGDAAEFTGFWSQFESTVDSKTNLSKVQKFTYLKSYLEGPALRALGGMKPSDENYKEAIRILHNKFGREDLIVNVHMQNLLNLESVKSASDLVGLRKLYDACEMNIRSLRSLGHDTAVNGSFLCPKVIGCMPKEIRLEYTKSLGSKPAMDVNAVVEFLRIQVESRETCELLGQMHGQGPSKSEFGSQDKFKPRPSNKFESHKPRQHSASVFATQIGHRTFFCIFCREEGHTTTNCTNFTLEEKKKMVLESNRCYVCLQYGHSARKCTSRFNSCKICQNNHNAAVCAKNEVNKPKISKNSATTVVTVQKLEPSEENLEIRANSVTCGVGKTVLLQTARALAKHPANGRGEIVRCLLDSGSQASFVQEDLSKRLNLPVVGKCPVTISNFGNETPSTIERRLVRISLENTEIPSEIIEITAVEVPFICETDPSSDCEKIKRHMKKKGLQLADNSSSGTNIDFLIGGDCYWEFATGRAERISKALVAVETTLGWAVQGPAKLTSFTVGSYAVNVLKIGIDEKTIARTLESFWTLEGMGINEEANEPTESETFVKFQDEIKIEEGRYSVTFPWNRKKTELADNLSIATKRMDGLVRKFQKDPELYNEYKAVIEDQLNQGITEKVEEEVSAPIGTYYVPHQPVTKKDRTTTKLRVVLDASSKVQGALSLNDCMTSGPNLNPDLLQLLLKFRWHKVAVRADIEKAFLQVALQTKERDSVRFLWTKENGSGTIIENDYQILRMARVPFGVTASPFLLAATIKTHLGKYQEDLPEIFEALNEGLYIDDLVSGGTDVETAHELAIKATKILKDGKMNLRKWQTNSLELRKIWMKEAELQENVIKYDGKIEPEEEKILGLIWNPTTDILSVDLSKLCSAPKTIAITKRSLLSMVAQIFDPVGILSPFVIRAKVLFQILWEKKLAWDEKLPEDVTPLFGKWLEELEELRNLTIARCYFSNIENKIEKMELHCFTDASQRAYAAVVYLRCVTKNKIVTTSFVTSKTRVAPLKEITVPKLELMACLLGARLVNNVKTTYKGENFELKCWTDSTIALSWLRSPSKTWRPFVQNRTMEIQKLVEPRNWSWCPGSQNPADIPSRGATAKELMEKQEWWEGPPWLKEEQTKWPNNKEGETEEHNLEEIEKERRKLVMVIEVNKPLGIQSIVDLNRHNSINKSFRIAAYVYRFISNLKQERKITGPISSEELTRVEIKFIQDIQKQDYGLEITALKENKAISKTSKIATLDPKLNDQGLLCLGGRLEESSFSYATKHPIIINRNQNLARLLMIRSHEEVAHEGIQATVTQARERYWVIAGRQLARNVVRHCFKCKKYHAKPLDAPMGLLPGNRITESPPFTVIGVDFGGPLMVKVGKDVEKSYVCLFTCCVTRAVHLELVPTQSTYEFLMAFRRMISRRGIPTSVYSDNGKSFKSAKDDLKKLFENIQSDEVRQFFCHKNIEWRFIVEHAPWWGGHYERLIKSTKVILRKILGKALLTYAELETILTECEGVINSRPITYTLNNGNEPEPLTPAHLLIGKRVTCLPPLNPKFLTTPKNKNEFVKRLRYRINLMERLFKRWRLEYLLELRTAHHIKLAKTCAKIKVGDVMIVHEDITPKHMWKLGLVTEIIEGRDGNVRACIVKLGNGSKIRRPVQLLYALEVTDNDV